MEENSTKFSHSSPFWKHELIYAKGLAQERANTTTKLRERDSRDDAASAQTAQECRHLLRSREERPRTVIALREVGE